MTRDKLTRDKLTRDKLTRDMLTIDKLTRDKLTRDMLTIDKLTKRQADRHGNRWVAADILGNQNIEGPILAVRYAGWHSVPLEYSK